MSGAAPDPIDQLVEAIHRSVFHDEADPAYSAVLRLAEVARAAQVFLEEHQRQKGAVLGEFDFLIYEEMETRLRDALARVGSPK